MEQPTTVFQSISDFFKDKLRNPIFGTYILVVIIRNWKAIYFALAVNSDVPVNEKLYHLEGYFEGRALGYEILVTIGITFIILIVAYIIGSVGIFLQNIYEKRVIPWIKKITFFRGLVPFENLKKQLEHIEFLETQMSDLQDKISTANVLNKNSTSQISELKSKNEELNRLLRNPELVYLRSIYHELTDGDQTKFDNFSFALDMLKSGDRTGFTKYKAYFKRLSKVGLVSIKEVGNNEFTWEDCQLTHTGQRFLQNLSQLF